MPNDVQTLETQPRDQSPLSDLMETLPTYRARALIYILIVLLAVLFAYAWFGRVDIIVTAPVVLIPEGDVHLVQLDTDGWIKEIKVREGDAVKPGDQLATVEVKEVSNHLFAIRTAQIEMKDARQEVDEVLPIRKEALDRQISSLRKRIAVLDHTQTLLDTRGANEKASKNDTEAMHKLENDKQEQIQKRLEVEIKNAQRAVELWTKEVEANARLRSKSVVTEIQFLNVQRSWEEAQATLQKSQSMLREAEAETKLIDRRFSTAKKQHDRTLAELQEQVNQNLANKQALQAEIDQRRSEQVLAENESQRKLKLAEARMVQAKEQARINLRGLDSPDLEEIVQGRVPATNAIRVLAGQGGRVARIMARRIGGEVVQRGQTLMTVVPDGVELVAEIRVPNKDIGQVRAGLATRPNGVEMKLKLDAFPFAECGAVTCTIKETAITADTPPQDRPGESHYRVEARLHPPGKEDKIQQTIDVKGKSQNLLPGMTGQADIVTEQKTILELIIKPFAEVAKPRPAQP